MHRDELTVYDARQRELVKRVHEDLVCLLVVLIEAFVLEVEKRCQLSTFVVAAQEENGVRVVDLDTIKMGVP
jgi:hypothetical protein